MPVSHKHQTGRSVSRLCLCTLTYKGAVSQCVNTCLDGPKLDHLNVEKAGIMRLWGQSVMMVCLGDARNVVTTSKSYTGTLWERILSTESLKQ